MMREAFLSKKRTFANATRVRIGDKMPIPPVGAKIIEEMMYDAISKWCGDDLAGDGIVDNEGDAA